MVLAGQMNYSVLNQSDDISGSITTNLLKDNYHELVNIQDLQESKGTLLGKCVISSIRPSFR
jgi:hypothetical protein